MTRIRQRLAPGRTWRARNNGSPSRHRLLRKAPAASTSLVGKFAILSLIPTALLGLILAENLSTQIRTRALENATQAAQLVARSGIQPLLSPEDLKAGLPPERLQVVDSALRSTLLGHEVAAVRIWGRDARVIYSEDHSLIGRTFPGNEELEEALEGKVESELFDGARAEQRIDPTFKVFQRYGDLLEVYVPLVFSGDEEPAGAFEIYLPYRPIAEIVSRDTRKLYLLLVIGLAFLYVVLLPIAYRTGRVLRDQTVKLKRLLSREQETVRRLQELDRMKSEFISTASHEMRTPLTTIIGVAKSLRQPQFAEDVALREEFLGRLEGQGDRLLQLVDQLLQTARLEGRRAEPQIESFDFPTLAQEAAGRIDPSQMTVELDLPGDLPPMVSDRGMVGQILANLLSNAEKYSSRGAACRIFAQAWPEGIRFHVEDHGVGMAPHQLERIFEPFWQADSSTTREQGGVGLGLYLVKLLVSALGGEISVESRPYQGSRFTVSLPNRIAPEPDGDLAGGLIAAGHASSR
jgi:signal transduction histidine kinase